MRALALLAGVLALVVLAPSATGGLKPTQCNGLSDVGSAAAAGCYHRDKRLGPKGLPGPKDPVGKLTRGYRRFGKLHRHSFLRKFWSGTIASGRWIYPPRDGFAGPETQVKLVVGALIDRFGRAQGGQYLSPGGTSFAMRAIPPGSLDTYPDKVAYNYHLYRVTAPFAVQAGAIAPWFGQRGGGVQFKLADVDVATLITRNELVEVTPTRARLARATAALKTYAGR